LLCPAIVIEANYSKKLGLPAYSSHSYSVTIRSEVSDLSAVERESAKLYSILQQSVDREMQEPGFVPDGNGHGSTAPRATNGPTTHSNGDQWSCSDKQRELILKIVDASIGLTCTLKSGTADWIASSSPTIYIRTSRSSCAS
jgi:hypothetical protein